MILLGIYSVVLFRIFPAANRVISNLQQLTGGTSIINFIFEDFEKANKNFSTNKSYKSKEISFHDEIEIKNLNFRYKIKEKENLLSNINIKIKKKSSIGIIGPSGSGKSTFINIILGLIKQDAVKYLLMEIK